MDELWNEASIDYVRADGVHEAIDTLSGILRGLPKRIINAPMGEAAQYLERMGMPQVCPSDLSDTQHNVRDLKAYFVIGRQSPSNTHHVEGCAWSPVQPLQRRALLIYC